MPYKITVILNNREKNCSLCSVVKGYKGLKGIFVIAFLVVCSFLLEVIMLMPDLAPFPTNFSKLF